MTIMTTLNFENNLHLTEMLKIMCCPVCKAQSNSNSYEIELEYFQEKQMLICKKMQHSFPVINNIAVLTNY